MRMALVVAGLLLAAVAATYARYQSLHPCDWMERTWRRTTICR